MRVAAPMLGRFGLAALAIATFAPGPVIAATSAAGSTAPAVVAPTVVAAVPALANAAYGGYTTVVYVQNVGTAAANVLIHYFDTTGTAVGIGDQATVQPNGTWVVRQDNGNSFAAHAAGSGIVLSDQPVATFVNEFAPGGGDATSYTGIDLKTGAFSTLFAPAIANQAYGGYTTGIGLVNVGTVPADVTITYRDGAGATVKTQIVSALQPSAYAALYSGDATLALPVGFAGTATFVSSAGAIGAVVNETGPGGQFSSYDAVPDGLPTLYAPAALRNAYGGYNTGMGIQNVTPTAGTVTINYYNGAGMATTTTYPIAANGYIGVYQGTDIPADGAYTAKLSSTVRIAAIVNEIAPSTTAAQQSTSYNTFPTGFSRLHLPLVESAGSDGWSTGEGIMNTGSVATTVTVSYYDPTTGVAVGTPQSQMLQPNAFWGLYQPTGGLPTGMRASAIVTTGIGGRVAVITNEASATSFMSYIGQTPGVVLHGQVTDAVSHSAVQGIRVVGVDATTIGGEFFRFDVTSTDAAGNYALVVPDYSTVKVHFFQVTPVNPAYLQQWWNNKPDPFSGDPVAVTGETFNINAALARGLLVHGQATDSVSHAGIQNIGVSAVDSSVLCCPFRFLGGAGTDSSGNYAMVVPTGSTVKVQFFSGAPGLTYLQQWWNNKLDFPSADSITVNAETFNVNAAMVAGYFVHGQATDATTHLAVAGFGVSAVDATAPCCFFHNFDFAQTDTGGNYQVLVPKGSSVKIWFNRTPSSPPYVQQWYNNKLDFNSADPITVNAETFNINAALVAGYFVHGQVTDATSHAPVAGFGVSAVDASAPCCFFNNFDFAQTDVSGNYQVLVPKGSTVKISFNRTPTSPLYIQQWYNNKPDFSSADPIIVNAETFNINAALAAGYFVHGQATDSVTHAAVAGFNVQAADANVPCCPFRVLDNTQTDVAGNYQVLVPKGSVVKIQFFGTPNSPPYLAQWYNNMPDFSSANPITVNAETFNINAALVRGQFVHGQVTDAVSHAGIQGVGVGAFDSTIPCCTFPNLGNAQTDMSGNYTLVLPTGSKVKIQFFPGPGPQPVPYIQQWWNNKPDFSTADVVTVNAETFNINAALSRGQFVHGQVTDAVSHAGIQGVGVGAFDSTIPCCPFPNLGNAQTDMSGNYTLVVPTGSSVKIQFFPGGPGPQPLPYIQQWWNNKSDFSTADVVTVNAETFSINAALARGQFVHGNVTDAVTHLGVGGVNVQAVDPGVTCCPFKDLGDAQTDASGAYVLVVPAGSTVKIQFFTFRPNNKYITQWWNNKPDFPVADPIVVNAAAFNINAALTPASYISGRVTDSATHAGIQGVNVTAFDSTVACCKVVAGAQTDANGNYQFLVPTGATVKVQFTPGVTPYVQQWWNNKVDFPTADTVAATADVNNINAAMVHT